MKPWKIILLSLFVLFAVGVMLLIQWMRPYNLQTELAAARKAGIALTPADLHIKAPPASGNAAAEYKALQALEKKKPIQSDAFENSLKKGTPLSLMNAHSAALLQKMITSRPDVSRLVHAAARKPHFYVHRSLTVAYLFPEDAHIREAAKWIRWESVLLARQGRFMEAVDNQTLGLRIANQAGEEPVLIANLLSSACEGITVQGFQDIMNMAGPNAAVAEKVRGTLAGYNTNRDLTRSLQAEMVIGMNLLTEFATPGDVAAFASSDDSSSKSAKQTVPPFIKWIFMDPSKAIYVHWMVRTIEASRLPQAERGKALKKVETEMTRSLGKRPTGLLTGIMMPVFSSAADSEVRAIARRNLTTTMAALLAVRARTGRFPATLDGSIQPPPVDPFTGGQLEYKMTKNGFSVAANPTITDETPKEAAKLRRYFTIYYPPRIHPETDSLPDRPAAAPPGGPPTSVPPTPGGPPMPGPG